MDSKIVTFLSFWGILYYKKSVFNLLLITIIARALGGLYRKLLIGKLPVPRNGAVFITGCSSGIGNHAALHLAQRGFTVFAGVRKSDDAKAIASKHQNIIPVIIDVTKQSEVEAAANTVSQKLTEKNMKLIAVINNAGYPETGVLEEMPLDRLRVQFEVNVVGQVAVSQSFLPLLRKHRHPGHSPRLVFVSSGFGMLCFPNMGPYCATKFAIEAIGETFRMELQSWDIQVVLLEPGSIKTHFNAVAKQHLSENVPSSGDEVAQRYKRMSQQTAANQVLMDRLNESTDTTNAAILECLLDRVPKTRYPAGKDVAYGLPIILSLPDRLRDRLFARFFR